MLPLGFVESEINLYRDMSPEANDEDWTQLEEYHLASRRGRSRSGQISEIKKLRNGHKDADSRPSTSVLNGLPHDSGNENITRSETIVDNAGPFDNRILTSPCPSHGCIQPDALASQQTHNSRRSLTRERLFGRGHQAPVKAKGKSKVSQRTSDSGFGGGGRRIRRNYFQTVLKLMEQPPPSLSSNTLKGLVIFLAVHDNEQLATSDQATKRLEFMMKHGATLAPFYDQEIVTHIVTDLAKKAEIAGILGLTSCDDVPGHIRIVRWTWITESINDGKLADQLKAERYPARAYRQKELTIEYKNAPVHTFSNNEIPAQEFFTIELASSQGQGCDASIPHQIFVPSAKVSPKCGTKPIANTSENDPLALFYEQAAYGADDQEHGDHQLSNSSSADEASGSAVSSPNLYRKNGYACRDVSRVYQCHNEDIVSKLQELLKIHEANLQPGDQWRTLGYRKAIASLRRCPKRISSVEEAQKLPGIGSKTLLKISEILETGELQRLRYERSEEVRVRSVLSGIYGVGSKTASLWYRKGIKSLDDVRSRKGGIVLTKAQELGLQYYDDLQSRMPREEAEVIYKKVRQAALSIDPMLWVEIMGSYRRGCSDCGDVDILITRPTHDGQTHRGLLNKILLCLKEDEVITHTLGEPDNGDELEAKFMGLCRVDSMTKTRRIDILTVPFECWGASLIYFTGDDIFNRSMRLLARHQGLTLNQRGLWKGASRFSRTNEQITEGVLVASTEEDIFRRLGVPWQEPHERIRSR